MPLRAFSYPLPETRFIQAGSRLFKFKIRNGSNVRGCEVNDEQVSQEIEDAIRVVLANLDCLQPFATKHFSVFPYKSKWKRVSQLQFQKGFVKLTAYPFLLTLYLETRESSCPRPAAKRTGNQIHVRVTGPDVLPVDRPVCHSKRSRQEQPLEGSPVQLSLWENTGLEGHEMDREPHLWTNQPETMASDGGVRESLSLPHKDSSYAPRVSPPPARLCYCSSHSQLPECFVPTRLGAAVDGKEARETQGEPVTGAQEGQSHSPKRSTITGDCTSVLIRWACKIFPLSLFCGHKKK